MTKSKAGKHPSNTCEKLFNRGLIPQNRKQNSGNKAKNQKFTLGKYIVSIDKILGRPFATFGFGKLFLALAMFYKKWITHTMYSID